MSSEDESDDFSQAIGVNEDDPEAGTLEDRVKIREKLSTMSFEEIQKLKEKIGSKLYNETLFGSKTRNPKTDFKRANKNRPREASSKIRIKKVHNVVQKIQTQVPRDPRFDSLCGEYDDKIFKTNYKFVNDIRKKERKHLEKELQNTSDPDRKKQIKYLMQRIDNQIREQEKKEKIDQQKLEEKIEMRQQLKRGEKPVYKKKSEQKITNLIHKYEELKKTNKLQKHIEKRSKKLSVKERKNNEASIYD